MESTTRFTRVFFRIIGGGIADLSVKTTAAEGMLMDHAWTSMEDDEINFSDKIVLVSGGTGGLGNAVSLAFLEEGARLVVTYWKEEEFAALK
jgi:FlaA1/EpsC-like NDP-sugar epimerase